MSLPGRLSLFGVSIALAMAASGCGPERSLGEELWRDRCARCHGIDARGNTVRYMGNPWADLSDDSWRTAGDPNTVLEVTRSGVVGHMPPNDELTAEELDAVVDWLYYLRGEVP